LNTTKLYRLHSFKTNQLFTVAIVQSYHRTPALGQVLKSLFLFYLFLSTIIVRFFSEFVKEDKYLMTTRIKYPSIYTLVRLPSFQSMLFVTLSLSPRNITSVCYILNISFCFCVHYCLLCSLYVLVLYIYLISNCCKYHKYNNPTSCCKYNGSPAARKISP
jgi:hypothetical protein